MNTIANFTNNITSCFDTEAVESLVSIILQLPGDPAGGRKGGFFSIYESVSMSMVTKSFGDFPKEKAGQYFRNSTEKVTRLVKNPEHYRSFQSRDEAKEWWGGGIHYVYLYCAFSGFPEKLDEALSLIYAIYVTHYSLDRKTFKHTFKNAVLHQQKTQYKDNEFIQPVFKIFVAEQKNENIIPLADNLSPAERECEIIKAALEKHKGKRKNAAQELGISERTLYRKCRDYDLN
jgi:DNA-binding protein Fis